MESPSEAFRFSRRPASDSDNGGWSLLRAKAKGDLKVVSLADDFFGLETHYWAGRTTPCRTVDCPACLSGMLSRWAGYLPCLAVPKWNPVIVEFTGSASADLDSIRERLTTLRAVNLIFRRPNEKANGRVRADDCGMYKEPARLPPAPAVWPILAKIFRVNPNLFPAVVEEDLTPSKEDADIGRCQQNATGVRTTESFRLPSRDCDGQTLFPIITGENGKATL
jgi:hypothetical protein